MRLLRRGDKFIEVADDGITLCFWSSDGLGYEARVEEDGFPACDGVGADQRVLGGDWVATNSPTQGIGSICLDLR